MPTEKELDAARARALLAIQNFRFCAELERAIKEHGDDMDSPRTLHNVLAEMFAAGMKWERDRAKMEQPARKGTTGQRPKEGTTMENVLGKMLRELRSHVGNLKDAAGRSDAGRVHAIAATDLEKVAGLYALHGMLEESKAAVDLEELRTEAYDRGATEAEARD